jgi:hypothetical protein
MKFLLSHGGIVDLGGVGGRTPLMTGNFLPFMHRRLILMHMYMYMYMYMYL